MVDLIRGPDSTVRLAYCRSRRVPAAAPREVTLVRDEIKLEDKAAKSEVIEVGGGFKGRGDRDPGVLS